MTDTPTLSASEARIRLDSIVKPLRALLDVEKVLDAAIAAEAEARDHAGEVARKRDAIQAIDSELAAAKDRLAIAKAKADGAAAVASKEAADIIANAKAEAAKVLDAAKAKAAKVEAAASKATADALAKVAECEAACRKALDDKHATEGVLSDLTKAVAAEQAKLAAIREAIATATKV